MIEAGQAKAAHHQAGGAPLVGATGQGMKGMLAKAESMGSHVKGCPHGMVIALAGIIEGAKKSVAAIKTVLTILRKFMVVPAPIARRLAVG
jgi:hypothetical protein